MPRHIDTTRNKFNAAAEQLTKLTSARDEIKDRRVQKVAAVTNLGQELKVVPGRFSFLIDVQQLLDREPNPLARRPQEAALTKSVSELHSQFTFIAVRRGIL